LSIKGNKQYTVIVHEPFTLALASSKHGLTIAPSETEYALQWGEWMPRAQTVYKFYAETSVNQQKTPHCSTDKEQQFLAPLL
jgi:hypothetical protein